MQIAILSVASAAVGHAAGQQSSDLEAAWARFWAADGPDGRLDTVDDLIAAGVEIDEAARRLTAGPPRATDAPTGRRLGQHRVRGLDHPYLLLVPDSYDPARAYPVRVYLHGGVARADEPRGGSWWRRPERLARDDAISVFPASWAASQWWHDSQLRNLRTILDALRRTYNIDENRVHVLGISDGGTGAWYLAFLDPTPYAGFVPLIGHPAVLSSPRVGVEGQMHVANLRNRSFLAINGGLDRLYPSRSVAPYVELFRSAGIDLDFVDKEDHGHTVEWWPEEAERIDAFLSGAVRDPLPAHLVWQTATPNNTGRLHWLVIDELGAAANEADVEVYEREVSIGGRSRLVGFAKPRDSGIVEAVADGNRIDVITNNVRRFRLLLSPAQFDLAAPLTVAVNGEIRFAGPVAADVGTMLRWAARDLDRQMLFAHELAISLPRAGTGSGSGGR